MWPPYPTGSATARGDETTFTKSLIISLKDATANWYSRLPPGCIYFWQQLKGKFLLNFQGFQAELDTKEDFLSCAQWEKEILPNFYQRFLQLNAQSPEVSDDQVIAQAINALWAGPLHSHLIKERPKIVPELYEQFTKFNKSETQHFLKLEQQRKVSKPDKAPKPRYNENQWSYPKPIHNIDSDDCRPSENWKKNFGTPPQERHPRTFDQRFM
jgi:hypothetical protein